MRRLLRRALILAILGGGAYALIKRRQTAQQQDTVASEPSWPPFDSAVRGFAVVSDASVDPGSGHPGSGASDTPGSEASSSPVGSTPAEQRWVTPIDGMCPGSHPVKANDNSGIFHVPGGRFYNRTVPERCYANAEDAAVDGYRPAKA